MMRVTVPPAGNQAANEEQLSEIHQLFEEGGILLYPTDTIYGLGVDAVNEEAVKRLFILKRRIPTKAISVIVRDLGMAEEYVVVSERAHKLAEAFLPGPLTMLLPRRENVPDILVGGKPCLGIRMPDNAFCAQLMHVLPRPITTTSANISDQETRATPDEILQQFGESSSYIGAVVDQGPLRSPKASTVIDLVHPDTKIVREGIIPAEEIFTVLRQS